MANEINAERIQLMIQTALAAQAEVYAKESADRERILLADFEVRLQHATAVNHTPPASPNSSTRSTIDPQKLSQYGVSFYLIQRTRRHVHIGFVKSCCGSSICFGLRTFLFDFYSGGFQ